MRQGLHRRLVAFPEDGQRQQFAAVGAGQAQQHGVRAAGCRGIDARYRAAACVAPLQPGRQQFVLQTRTVFVRQIGREFAPQHESLQFRQCFGLGPVAFGQALASGQFQREETVRRQGQQVRRAACRRQGRRADDVDRHAAFEGGKIELHGLQGACEIGHAKDVHALPRAHVGQHLAVARIQEMQLAAAEQAAVAAAHGDDAPRPVQQRMRIGFLRLDVDRRIAEHRIGDRRQHQRLRIGAREAAVAVVGPLHRRAHAVAVAQMHVVAHADLVAVVQHRRAGQGQQQRRHEFDAAAVALQQRCEAPAYAEIQPRALIGRIGFPEIVALGVGDHLQGQLVVVAQEDGPLRQRRRRRRLAQDVADREAVFLRDRHVHARHQRKVERHVAFVVAAEIFQHVLGPLVRFGEQHAVGIVRIDLRAQALEYRVRAGQVLVAGAFLLAEIGDRVETEAVQADVEPEAQHLEHRVEHQRVVEVQIGLVRVEAVEVVAAGDRVPAPVGFFDIGKNDACAGIGLVGVGPDVELVLGRAARCVACALEPRMVGRGVVQHEIADHAQAARMRRIEEAAQVVQGAVVRMHVEIVGHVVAVVAARRRVVGQQPERVDAERYQIVQSREQAGEIADAVVVAVEERLDVDLVDHRFLVPVDPAAIDGDGRGAGAAGSVRRHGPAAGRRVRSSAPRKFSLQRWMLPSRSTRIADCQRRWRSSSGMVSARAIAREQPSMS